MQEKGEKERESSSRGEGELRREVAEALRELRRLIRKAREEAGGQK